jgi:chromosome segregation ATPase
LGGSEEEIKALEQQRAVAAAAEAERSARLQATEEDLGVSRQALERAAAEKAALLEQVKTATATAEALHARHEETNANLRRELKETTASLTAEREGLVKALEGERETGGGERAGLREELVAHKGKVESLEAALEEAKATSQSLAEQREQLMRELGSSREQHALSSMKTVELTGKLEAATSEGGTNLERLKDDLEREREQAEHKLEGERAKAEALRNDLGVEKQHRSEAEAARRQAEGERGQQELLIHKVEAERDQQGAKAEGLRAEVARLSASLSELLSHKDQLSTQGSSLEQRLHESTQQRYCYWRWEWSTGTYKVVYL